jgi:hypothetical protein
MSRVINTNSPTKIRNQARRTIAEILRLLSTKPELDQESKDMAAMAVFLLREIADSVRVTVEAWEKRGYWMKAERFLRDWEWPAEAAANLEDVIRNEAWELFPQLLAELLPRFSDIQIKKLTRSPGEWRGAHARLLAEPPTPLPW